MFPGLDETRREETSVSVLGIPNWGSVNLFSGFSQLGISETETEVSSKPPRKKEFRNSRGSDDRPRLHSAVLAQRASDLVYAVRDTIHCELRDIGPDEAWGRTVEIRRRNSNGDIGRFEQSP